MPLIIKGNHIDGERTSVCVPVTAKNRDELVPIVARLIRRGVKMIEWRIDCYEDHEDFENVRETLFMLRRFTDEVVFIATLRTEAEGGMAKLNGEALLSYYKAIAQTHCADIIDVEYLSLGDNLKEAVDMLHANGALVLLSHHDFKKTPEDVKLSGLFYDMYEKDANTLF